MWAKGIGGEGGRLAGVVGWWVIPAHIAPSLTETPKSINSLSELYAAFATNHTKEISRKYVIGDLEGHIEGR
jgi:hypothetical protein